MRRGHSYDYITLYKSLSYKSRARECLLLAVKKPNATVTGCEKGQRAGNSDNCGQPEGKVSQETPQAHSPREMNSAKNLSEVSLEADFSQAGF